MKKPFFLFAVLPPLLFSSCIKDEEMFREADMENVDLNDEIFITDTPVRESVINVYVSDTAGTRYKSFAPTFVISDGATAFPESGTTVEFKDYKAAYTVTSEDKSLKRNFIIRITQIEQLNTGFEEWTTAGSIWKYPAMVDNLWESANPGISVATIGKIPEYPTVRTTDSHRGRYAAKLETKKGGTYWDQHIPIFSGSLFRGKFVLNTKEFVKSALFGQPHPEYMGKPKTFAGYYKYAPGETFIDEDGKPVAGRTDECSVFAAYYRVDKGDTSNSSYLTAYDVLDFSSDKIIAKAVLADRSAKSGYTRFSIPFEYTEQPDYKKYDYRLAVVFASSKEGDFYRGAIGSTLIVDDVTVVCEF